MQDHWTETILRPVILSTIAFGLLSAAANIDGLSYPADLFTDIMVWPVDGTDTMTAPQTRLAWALLGGFLTSWGILQWMILTRVVPIDRALGRRMLMTSVLIWFVLDTSGSLLAGLPANAAANLFFLAIYAIPLAAMPGGANAMIGGRA